ncbi:MAG TPA: ATP-binding protein [Blastocatellia bacterium]|nr:ATP-binding protein [Blastocatellia bacterium]
MDSEQLNRSNAPSAGSLPRPSHRSPNRTTQQQRNAIQRRQFRYESKILLLSLLSGLPALLIAVLLLWLGDYSVKVQLTAILFVSVCWLICAFALRERVVRPLQTISNLLAALHEEDFSVRARGASRDDALGELLIEVNALSETLREQKLSALEAATLLRSVIAEIEVAVFAFDNDERLRLINRAGERLLGQPIERMIGKRAEDLGLHDCLTIAEPRTINLNFPGAGPGGFGRWEARHGYFRSHGIQHHLLVLTDLSKALRDEERQAWQRLVRVLGHELNNTLAPIKSIAGSMRTLLDRKPRADDWEDDLSRGLDVISSRAESLIRFMKAYAQLARLPQPTKRDVNVKSLAERVAKIETRLPVIVNQGPEITIQADVDQLEQLLINLIRNAVDASLENGGKPVSLSWIKSNYLEFRIEDNGPGLSGTTNLFVPFFTTKPNGSGIGLVLSRQIAEAHGGNLILENRAEGGCVARLRLPI